jgi:hypothetical protein
MSGPALLRLLLGVLSLLSLWACGPSDELYDFDGDGSLDSEDCAPQDPDVYPGQLVDCIDEEETDTNCDGSDGIDSDGDGYARPSQSEDCAGGLDCNDSDPAVHPGATEVPDNALDEDCDGVVLFCDADGDGVLAIACGGSDCDDFSAICAANCDDADGDGYRFCDGDCDDDDPDFHEGSPEVCNGLDDDCNGYVPADELDYDGDGIAQCDGDCNDLDPTVAPSLPELCDGIDNNCDDSTEDEQVDSDGDGYPPCSFWDSAGEWVPGDDCDDGDPANYAQNTEACDGQDNDCNPATDELIDGDGDGEAVCDGDCDDGNATVSTSGVESCDVEDLDQDCDGLIDDDDPDAAGCQWLSVAVGNSHACAIAVDGSVSCWGENGFGQFNAPAGSFVELDLGTGRTFGLDTQGTLHNLGAFGGTIQDVAFFSSTTAKVLFQTVGGIDLLEWSGSVGSSVVPLGLEPGPVIDLGAHYSASCAVLADGSLDCWGSNNLGHLLFPPGAFVEVECAPLGCCGRTSASAIECWGDGTGQSWMPLTGTYQSLVVGVDDVCSSLVAFGLTPSGVLDMTSSECPWSTSVALAPPPGLFLQVDCFDDTCCAVTQSNTLECWGENGHGEASPP